MLQHERGVQKKIFRRLACIKNVALPCIKVANYARGKIGGDRVESGREDARSLNFQQIGAEQNRTENGDFCSLVRKSDEC